MPYFGLAKSYFKTFRYRCCAWVISFLCFTNFRPNLFFVKPSNPQLTADLCGLHPLQKSQKMIQSAFCNGYLESFGRCINRRFSVGLIVVGQWLAFLTCDYDVQGSNRDKKLEEFRHQFEVFYIITTLHDCLNQLNMAGPKHK